MQTMPYKPPTRNWNQNPSMGGMMLDSFAGYGNQLQNAFGNAAGQAAMLQATGNQGGRGPGGGDGGGMRGPFFDLQPVPSADQMPTQKDLWGQMGMQDQMQQHARGQRQANWQQDLNQRQQEFEATWPQREKMLNAFVQALGSLFGGGGGMPTAFNTNFGASGGITPQPPASPQATTNPVNPFARFA